MFTSARETIEHFECGLIFPTGAVFFFERMCAQIANVFHELSPW